MIHYVPICYDDASLEYSNILSGLSAFEDASPKSKDIFEISHDG